MPFCGFNKQMLDGLRQFGQGLWEQAELRAREDGLNINESITQEIDEMGIFLEILSRKDPMRYQSLKGAALLSRALYQAAAHSEVPKEAFFADLEEMLNWFVSIDQKYYGELRPNASPQEALRQLGEWL